jgi:hypothetical protein
MCSDPVIQSVLTDAVPPIVLFHACHPAALLIARLVVVAAGGSGVGTDVACFVLPVRGVVRHAAQQQVHGEDGEKQLQGVQRVEDGSVSNGQRSELIIFARVIHSKFGLKENLSGLQVGGESCNAECAANKCSSAATAVKRANICGIALHAHRRSSHLYLPMCFHILSPTMSHPRRRHSSSRRCSAHTKPAMIPAIPYSAIWYQNEEERRALNQARLFSPQRRWRRKWSAATEELSGRLQPGRLLPRTHGTVPYQF